MKCALVMNNRMIYDRRQKYKKGPDKFLEMQCRQTLIAYGRDVYMRAKQIHDLPEIVAVTDSKRPKEVVELKAASKIL